MMRLPVDVKYALRLLGRSPGFALLTVIVLAGGAAVSIFTHSFLSPLMFKPLPIADGERVVKLFGSHQGQRRLLDALELAEIREETDTLEEIGAYTGGSVIVSAGDASRDLHATRSEWNLFEFTGVQPVKGRGFRPGDSLPGTERVAVLSHKVWEGFYGADPEIVDRVVSVNSEPARIIGVMPEGFRFPVSTDLWLPISAGLLDPVGRGEAFLSAFAKVRPGIGRDRVDAELHSLMQRIRSVHPPVSEDAQIADSAFANSFQSAQIPDAMPLIFVLYLMAGFILLLACINVGNLLLARANGRVKEIAIRVALGAPQKRLVLQMMWESIFICVAGGVLALLLAGWALEAIDVWARSQLQGGLAFWWQWGMDGQTVLSAIAVILLTIVLAGGVPAWRATRGDFNAVLKDGTRGAQGRRVGRISRSLVVIEVVLLSVVIFLGGVLAVGSYQVINVDQGLDTRNALAAPLDLDADRYAGERAQLQFFERLQQRVTGRPAIRDAVVLAEIDGGRPAVAIEGHEYPRREDYPQAYARSIAGSLEVLGIRLREGRMLDAADRGGTAPVAVVSESFAARHWPNGSAVGHRLRLAGDSADSQWRTVVGVVSDVINGNPMSRDRSAVTLYVPMPQRPAPAANVILKHAGDEMAARSALYGSLAAIDPQVLPRQVIDFEESINQLTLLARSATDVLLKSGLFALILAVMGIYGLTANSITRRAQEIGIRRALGATDSGIVRLLMRQGSGQLVIGLSAGLMIAVLASLLFNRILAIDGLVYVTVGVLVPLMIASVVLVAIYFPSRYAVRLEPSDALRRD